MNLVYKLQEQKMLLVWLSLASNVVGSSNDKNSSPYKLLLTSTRVPGLSKGGLNENYHISRTCHDIDMKLGPVTKLDNRKTATSYKIDDDILSGNCDAIVFFPIYS